MNSLAVEQSDKYFRLLAENLIVGVFILSKEFEFLFVNDYFCSILGYDKQELLTKTLIDITLPDDIKLCSVEFESVFTKSQDGFQIEVRFLTKEGDFLWCEISISANRNNDGEIDFFSGILNDISIRKIIETQLIDSQQLFSTIFKNSPVASVLGAIDSLIYLDVNDSFLRQTGYLRTEVIGKKSSELSFFENDNEKDIMIDKVKEQGFIDGYEINCKKKNGDIFTVLFSISIVKAYNQPCLLLTAMDISERIEAEKALKESEFNYRTLVDFLPDGIAVHQHGKIVFANGTAVRMLDGESDKDFIGTTAIDIVHPDYKKEVLERIKTTSQNKEGAPLIEEIFVTLTGRLINVEVASLPFLFKGKNATLVVFRDISERKLAEFELIKAKNKAEESDRLKSSFLANMSHEIRTPMNAIKGFAKLLEDTELTQEKKNQFIKIINQRTDDLLMLINDLLDTAKIEAGQMSISETTENIDNLLNDIYQFFISQLEMRNDKNQIELKIINELSLHQCYFTADFFRLRQILINIINNALKFTDRGHIHFGVKLLPDHNLLFFIEDTGIGIPSNMQEYVFAPFRQLDDNKITRQQSGTGLGLSIVNGLLKLMKGKVWFESEIERGTTFYFTIPFKQHISVKMEKHMVINDTFDWKTKTILIIEDDNFNAQLIIEFLRKTNVEILMASTGLDALTLFKQNPQIDITLMDIQLPDINGFQLTQMFKALNPKALIIAQTAYAADTDKKRALSSGCTDYISKPITQKKLLSLLQSYLHK